MASTKTNRDFFFCSAPKRPTMCRYKNNKCCHNCEDIDDCLKIHRKARISLLPCKDILDDMEICEFQV